MQIRVEEASDYRRVEEITRDAFWNLYQPGADEHYIVHIMRQRPEFITQLSLVAVDDSNRLLGHICYTRSFIVQESGDLYNTVTFGPFSVTPDCKGKGIGSRLLETSFQKAKETGFKVVIIRGYPDLYKKFGFQNCRKFEITDEEGNFPKGLLVKELEQGALHGIRGKFKESEAFNVEADQLAEFDKTFENKPKFETYSQKAFEIMLPLLSGDEEPMEVREWSHRIEPISDQLP